MDEIEERIDDYLSEEDIFSLSESDEILNEVTKVDTKSIYRIFRDIETVLRRSGIKLSKEEQKKVIIAMTKGIEAEKWQICLEHPR